MSCDSVGIRRFIEKADRDPNLIPTYTVCTPFDEEILGGTHENVELEDFISSLERNYKIRMQPIFTVYEEEKQKDLNLIKERKGQAGFSRYPLRNREDEIYNQDKKLHLKKIKRNSTACTKHRRRTSVIRKAVAEKNREKALKAKEERERRQNAVQTRLQDLNSQDNRCPGRFATPLRTEKKKVISAAPPKRDHLKAAENNEKCNRIHDERPKEKTCCRSVRKRNTKKRSVRRESNVSTSSIDSESENKGNNTFERGHQKPIKGVLKKKVPGKSDHNKSVRFNETTTMFDIEKLSAHDATNIVFNFDLNDVPSWAKDGNLDLLMTQIDNTEDDNEFPFHSPSLIKY
uniref:INCENP_ARK-bind domain-containing protein n=1 Tax=Strongyloides venezuelensis TaxID=75913 RepID=A0A0K0FUJ0_STRVS